MGVLERVFGGKYNDEQLLSTVENAIAVDPLLSDPTSVTVSSKKGVIVLSGKVHSAQEKERVEALIRSTLTTHNLKYDQVVNDLQVV